MTRPVETDNCFPIAENDGSARAIQAVDRLKIINNPYTGNKRKMLFSIWEAIRNEKISSDRVCDLFSGSGSVSIFFKHMGSSVVSNDLLTFPYLSALSFVEYPENSIQGPEIAMFEDDGQGPGFVSERYGEKSKCPKFTEDEALSLDFFYRNLERSVGSIPDLIEKSAQREIRLGSSASGALYNVAASLTAVLNHILMSCHVGGRLNKGQVLANVDFRLRRQTDKRGSDETIYQGMGFHRRMFMPDMRYQNAKPCFACLGDAIDFLKKPLPPFDFIYIDPPYGGDQSDYAQMYQFCEEYIWQKPIQEIRRISDCAERFAKSKNYKEQFQNLLSSLPKEPAWVLSYNNSSWENIDTIKGILREFRSDIRDTTVEYRYQYRSRKNGQGSGIEYLIFAR